MATVKLPSPAEHLQLVQKQNEMFYAHVATETIARRGEAALDWHEFHQTWIDLMTGVKATENADSLVQFRLIEFFKTFAWLEHSIYCGAYHQQIRELRYMLEAMVQAHWLDVTMPTASAPEKVEWLGGQEPSMKEMLAETGVPDREVIYGLYRDLCKYVHPSLKELELAVFGGQVGARFASSFDEELFDLTREFARRTADALNYFVLLRFPEAAAKLQGSEFTMRSLREMGHRLTLSRLGPT